MAQPPKFELVEARSSALMTEVARLRYDDYSKRGFIRKNSTGLFYDKYDSEESRSFLLLGDDEPLATVRLSVSERRNAVGAQRSVAHFPSYDSYHDVLEAKLDAGNSIVEVSRLCIRGRRSLITKIYGAVTQVADEERIQYLFAAVRENHIRFYERMLFVKETEPRPHPLVDFDTVGMFCHYEIAKHEVSQLPLFADMWRGPQLK